MRSALIALILLAMCAAAHAEDQAIVACENVIKSELIAPKTYEAVSKSAIGGVVSITFDAVNKYNAPLRATDRCEFIRTRAGWVLSSSFSEDDMKAEFSSLIEKVKSGAMERAEAEKQIPLLERRYSAMVINYANKVLLAQQAGPYPIPPNMTSLSQ